MSCSESAVDESSSAVQSSIEYNLDETTKENRRLDEAFVEVV